MKGFGDFFSEARTSQASEKAKKLGLKGDGHGAWYDRTGELIAKTEKGDLHFYTKGQRPGKDVPNPAQPKAEPAPQIKAKATTVTGKGVAAAAPPEEQKSKGSGEEEKSNRGSDALTLVFGRFNPPTTGHKKLLDTAKGISGENDFRIYPSRSHDPKKNPLDPGTKIKFMKKMFADYEDEIVNEKDMKTIFDVLLTAQEEGYKEVTIVVGSDRLGEFKNLAQKYNGDLYDFENISVVPGGTRDSDAEGVEGMSASKIRKAVKDDDRKAFERGIPSSIGDDEINNLWNELKRSMGLDVTTDEKKGKTDKEKSAARYQADEKGKKASEKRRDYASARSTAVDDALKKHGSVSKHDKGETEVDKVLKKGGKKKKKTAKESVEMWEIAPSFDYTSLREKYYNKEIFKRGDIVESMTTGLRGKVTRRGANHLICVTENGIMFKSWIKDVSEAYTEKKKDSIERLPGKPNTLVGTKGYLKYAEKMTPGSAYGKEFINKYKAKK